MQFLEVWPSKWFQYINSILIKTKKKNYTRLTTSLALVSFIERLPLFLTNHIYLLFVNFRYFKHQTRK
jgi:hypothetical protein